MHPPAVQPVLLWLPAKAVGGVGGLRQPPAGSAATSLSPRLTPAQTPSRSSHIPQLHSTAWQARLLAKTPATAFALEHTLYFVLYAQGMVPGLPSDTTIDESSELSEVSVQGLAGVLDGVGSLPVSASDSEEWEDVA
jgi:hypothetical protein